MEYNPYDLVTLRISGVEIQGRPYQFDSEPDNNQTMQNAFGNYVKPTHISTVCPECGQGINVENIQLPEPPFPVIDWVCPYCNPDVDPPTNVFMNPLVTGRIAEHHLDPLLHDPMEQVIQSDETVADRLGQDGPGSAGHATGALLVPDGEPDGSALLDDIKPEEHPLPEKEPKKVTKTVKKKTSKKTAKKKVKKKAVKKATKATEKRSPIKGTSMSRDTAEVQPEAHEAPPLITEAAPKMRLEKAEGLRPEFDDDDLVEDE
jgi:hypothetical protein